MLFVTLKYLQTRLEKTLQFCVAGIGNEHRLKRTVDCLMIGDFIVGISLVKRHALQFLKFGLFGVRPLDERLAGVTLSFLTNARGLIVDRCVIANHVLGEVAHLLVFGLLQRQFGRFDVDLSRRVGDWAIWASVVGYRCNGCQSQCKACHGSD
jgi:hypothetical protein